jgi:hypothetical protein
MDAVERVVLAELRTWYERIAAERFGGRLVPPVLELSRREGDLGRWTRGARTLSLAWSLVADRPWGEVISVLEHEMAHQYVDEVLGVHDEPPHGPTFRRVCLERGIDERAAGAPAEVAAEEDRIVRRIRKLLALADSPEEAEARAAAAAAFRLMLKHNVQLAEARATPRYTTRQVGDVVVRRPKHEHLLAGLLSRHFFVDVTLVPAFSVATLKPGRAVELAGTAENVELAAYVWDFLLGTGERLWRAHVRARGRVPRQRFLEGVVLGFRERLEGEAEAARQEGLVWVGDPGLDDFVGVRHPHRRAGRRLAVQSDATLAAGRAAGRGIVLRRPIHERGEGAIGALPGPDRRG